jgi:hypothetical protein
MLAHPRSRAARRALIICQSNRPALVRPPSRADLFGTGQVVLGARLSPRIFFCLDPNGSSCFRHADHPDRCGTDTRLRRGLLYAIATAKRE